MFLRLLRNLKLLFLAALIPFLSTTGGERKKVAIHHNLKRTLVGLSVHLVPFAACTTLIVLNLKTYYVGKDVSTTSLQFLAKLLELLTQASISNMALVYLRWLYLGRRPVPLGTLFAGLQITSLNYLWSLEFLGSASSNYFTGKRKFVFVGFVICNLLLAAAVGPSIAVCLIPKRQFFPIATAPVWANSDHETAFPGNLSETQARCVTGDTLPKCSWEAFPAILQASQDSITGIFRIPLQDDISVATELKNLDSWDLRSAMADRLQSSIFCCTEAGLFATTPTISTLLLLSIATARELDSRFILFNSMWSIQVRYINSQPLVGAVCKELEWPISDTSVVLQNAFDSKNSTISLNALKLPIHDRNSTSWTITWFDAPDSAPQVSLIAIVLPPAQLLGKLMVDYINQTETLYSDLDGTIHAEACSFAAGWAESIVMAGINADFAAGTIVTSNITKAPKGVVKISQHWASSLIDGWKSPGGESALDLIMPRILAQSSDGSSTAFLANILTYAMSRTLPDGWPSMDDLDSDESVEKAIKTSGTPMKDQLRLDYHIYYEGLAYSPHDFPVIISLVILFVYCIYVAIYTTIMFIKPLSSSAWDSVAELTALAILSAPTDKLRNTSAGVEMLNTFREPVNIQAVGSDHLEIVFQNDEQKRAADMVQKNKDY